MKKWKKTLIIIGSSFLGVAILLVAVPLAIMTINVDSSVKETKKTYSLNELKAINDSSFKALNEINHPDTYLKSLPVTGSYKEAINDFAYNIYANNTYADENFSFSPIGLYSNLSIVSLAAANSLTNKEFDELLNITKKIRSEQYPNMYQTDFFVTDSGTIQMYNGVFLTNKYNVNPEFINSLVDYYCEAYSLDFNKDKDVKKMLNWIDERVDETNFLSKDDLEIDQDSLAYFVSTMYFNNKWANKFVTSDTYKDKFTNINYQKENVDFMNHSYYGEYYMYDKYVSCYDYYANGLKIQYLVPLSSSDNIFTLLKGTNFLIEDETRLKESIIDLSVPKFESELLIDFSDELRSLGLEYTMSGANSLDNVFTNCPYPAYLDFTKQKNKISFDEDGTVIKSVTVSGMKATSAGPIQMDTLEVKLNQPFVYVIYDSNNLPIYMGNVETIN